MTFIPHMYGSRNKDVWWCRALKTDASKAYTFRFCFCINKEKGILEGGIFSGREQNHPCSNNGAQVLLIKWYCALKFSMYAHSMILKDFDKDTSSISVIKCILCKNVLMLWVSLWFSSTCLPYINAKLTLSVFVL